MKMLYAPCVGNWGGADGAASVRPIGYNFQSLTSKRQVEISDSSLLRNKRSSDAHLISTRTGSDPVLNIQIFIVIAHADPIGSVPVTSRDLIPKSHIPCF
jgi:hypothetical protein